MNNWSVSVLSPLSSDTEPSVVLVFDDAKYVFNAGENTNRAYLQSKQNWRKTRSIFATSVGTQRCSGLAGIMMSFADAAIKKLDLVGPPGMTHFVAAMRMFSYRETMPLKTIEAPHEIDWSPSPDPLYKDSNITVYSIPITPGEPPLPASPTSSLKRKRANSGARPNVELIQRLMTNYRWSPSSLEGEDAQEYRRMMLDIMFGDRVRDEAIQPSGLSPQQPKKKGSKQQPPKRGNNKAERSDELENYWQRPRPPAAYYKLLPPFSAPVKSALAYVVVGPRVRGKFDVAKAEALGVQGRLRALLTKGQTVTFETVVDGEKVQRTVQPEEVMGESEAPGVVIVLEVPTPDYIPSLSSAFEHSPFYSRFRSKAPEDIKEHQVRAVFHICGPGVLEDPRYQAFIAGFADATEHAVCSPDHASDPITFTRASFNQLVLNQLDGDMFPIQKFSLEPKKALPPHLLPMDANSSIRIRPHSPLFKADLTDRFHASVTSGNLIDVPSETLELFKEAREKVAKTQGPLTEGSDVKIIPLGTGSALPTVHRNVSSTLVQAPGWGNILLDAGEGTWGQLVRQFGQEGITQMLRDLKCIFISHIHADHHLGLAKILSKRQQLDPAPSEPLYLVANRGIHAYLREWSNLEDLGIQDSIEGNGVKSVISEALHWTDPTSYEVRVGGEERWVDFALSKRLAEGLVKSLGLVSFKTVSVEHRVRCYGAVIHHQDGWSISFSGDTTPTENLVKAGQDSTVLIHEATMADDQAEMAHAKAHSTFGQAIDVGKRMNAKHVLLTHFSARYPKMPPRVLKDGQPTSGPVVALAFDHVNYTIGTLWKMAIYREAIKQAFEDTAEEGEDEQLEAVVAREDELQNKAA